MNNDEYTKTFDDALNRIAELEAELAALYPYAEIGKLAFGGKWYERWRVDGSGWNLPYCAFCDKQNDHAPDCPIPSLLAHWLSHPEDDPANLPVIYI